MVSNMYSEVGTEKAPTNTPHHYIQNNLMKQSAGSEVTSHLAPEVCRLWEKKT